MVGRNFKNLNVLYLLHGKDLLLLVHDGLQVLRREPELVLQDLQVRREDCFGGSSFGVFLASVGGLLQQPRVVLHLNEAGAGLLKEKKFIASGTLYKRV